jgi:acyl carrier protein
LRAKLTEVMVPSEYWQIDTIPSLASGKVNRVALESIAAIALTDEQEWIGPRTETEAQLATIWRELLQLDKVDIEQNFFELGGHSLLALQMTARIRRALEVELPVRSVFNSPTIAALAEEVDRARASGLRTHAPTLRTYPAKARDVLDQLDALTTDEAKRLVETFLHET